MQRAPHDERERRAVPEPTEHHDGEQIDVGARARDAVAAERHVQVVAQPARERDVPPLPEVLERSRDVGRVEVDRQTKPEHQRQPAGDVRVAGEVAEDLRAEHHRQPEQHARILAVVVAVCQSRFTKTARLSAQTIFRKYPPAIRKIASLMTCRCGSPHARQLRQELDGAHDRAGDQLREERDEQQERAEVGERRDPPAIDVDGVAHRLERVEADPDRARRRRRSESPVARPSRCRDIVRRPAGRSSRT